MKTFTSSSDIMALLAQARETPTTEANDSRYARRDPINAPQSRWNSSTQIARPSGRALTHQILSRTFAPPAPTVVARRDAPKVVARVSMDTISSRLKGQRPAAARAAKSPGVAVEMDRKRHHLQRQQTAIRQPAALADSQQASSPDTSGRDAIQLLLFYRREVAKRLRADPMYMMTQDQQ
ncbi:hypothetical protein PINS_up005051 [Pythium insidiosum]|nr:hypothetical protein PINS_up005051 [Pythium insidiosum]